MIFLKSRALILFRELEILLFALSNYYVYLLFTKIIKPNNKEKYKNYIT